MYTLPVNASFEDPADLFRRAVEYFEWSKRHPLYEAKTFMYKGATFMAREPKARPFTMRGLCTFMGVTVATVAKYRSKGQDWVDVIEYIEQIIYTQKFEHAAAGLMNSAIIVRDLGLADKQELTGRDGGPLQVEQTNHEVSTFLSKLQGMMEEATG